MVTPTWKLKEEIELMMNQVLRPTWKLNEEIELRMNQIEMKEEMMWRS